MRIEELQINNIRCWYDYHVLTLNKYTVFIGENSSGKSTIQDTIYSGSTSTNITDAEISRGGTSPPSIYLILSFSKKEVNEIVDLLTNSSPMEADYSSFRNTSIDLWNRLIIKKSKKEIKGQTNRTICVEKKTNSNNTIVGLESYLTTLTKELIHTHQTIINHVINFLNNYFFQTLEQKLIRIPAKRSLSDEGVGEPIAISSIQHGDNLKRLLFNAINSQDNLLKDRYETFERIVGNWSFTTGKPIIKTEAGKQVELLFEVENGNPIPIEEVGDGIKEIIIIAGLCLLQQDKVILIEEPERHLHPRALRDLRDLLKHELIGQVILSTHSPVFVNEIDDITTVYKILRKDNKSRAIKIKNKKDLLDFRKEFGLMNSDFLFEDILVFVEGVSDVDAFTNWFEVLYPEDMSVKFIAVGGKDEIPYALALAVSLQLEMNFSYFAILDSDNETQEEKKKEIIKKLKGRNPKLLEKFGEDKLLERIYVLLKKNLEEYFTTAPRVFAGILDIDEKEIQSFFEQSAMNMNRKLRKLFAIYGKDSNRKFNKSKHVPIIAEKMKEHEIHPEIQRLFSQIRSSVVTKKNINFENQIP